jgi:hypothetical protein
VSNAVRPVHGRPGTDGRHGGPAADGPRYILTSQEDRTAREDDERLLARAAELGRVLFSQDQDFLRIAAEWQRQGRSFPGIVFAAQECVSIGRLAEDLELLLTCCEPGELQDRVIYLPLRSVSSPRSS